MSGNLVALAELLATSHRLKSLATVGPNRAADVIRVALHFVRLQIRHASPQGHWDSGGRWYPTTKHRCCAGLREPSRQFPLGLLKHCCTAEHVSYDSGLPSVSGAVRSIGRCLANAGLNGRLPEGVSDEDIEAVILDAFVKAWSKLASPRCSWASSSELHRCTLAEVIEMRMAARIQEELKEETFEMAAVETAPPALSVPIRRTRSRLL